MTVQPDNVTAVQSLSHSQEEILGSILRLRGLDRFDADLTYGNGVFYRGSIPEPRLKFDIDPQVEGVVAASSDSIPLASGSLQSAVFDPPFLTYIRSGRGGNGSMVMAGRFAGYWRYDELVEHYQSTLRETKRVLVDGGTLVFKCQDIVHNHQLHPTSAYVIQWAHSMGLRLVDTYVLGATHRMPAPNRAGTQRHARIHHSYFLVFEKRPVGRKVGPDYWIEVPE